MVVGGLRAEECDLAIKMKVTEDQNQLHDVR
jgi:hypothetical protein